MNSFGKDFASLPLFDPQKGIVIREPRRGGEGWWAGAPSVFVDPDDGRFYLTYRLREPRPLRGHTTRIASSQDGIRFEDIFEATRDEFHTLSIERCSLFKGRDGLWRWYVCYVDLVDNRWRVDILEAARPDGFRPSDTRPLLLSPGLGIEGIKDPNVFSAGGLCWMLLSHAETLPAASPDQESQKHTTGDIFNTGLTVSSSSLAVSSDGRRFRWLGAIGPERSEWDRYCLRITCLFPLEHGLWAAFYDGSASVEENYEERLGAATTLDWQTFYKISPEEPLLTLPFGSGSVRYTDVVRVQDGIYCYYEAARPDGGHELKVSILPEGS